MTQTQARSANTRNARLSRAEAQEFLHTEAALLDAGRHDQWLELFAQDGVFWVPCNELDNDPARCVSIIYDTREALELRVRRLQIGRTVQEITSRTLHLISNVTVEPPGEDPTLVAVRAGLALYEVHARRNACYPAQCRYLLRRDSAPDSAGAGWRIVLKKVAFLGNDQFLDNLAFLF
jgi:benzoate/toluate 1,2-dioxygenase beta subunit